MVTGASGLLGRQIMLALQDGQWEVRGLYSSRAHSQPDLVQCDLLKEGEVARLLAEFRPDAVIHSAAERRPDVVFKQPQVARKLNIEVTQHLAEACQKHNSFLIFLSTDYIFDGKNPPYATDATPHPLSTYGEQKVEGENITLETCSSSCVVRVPLLFGPMEYMKESGVTALHIELEKGVKKADHTQSRYPTYTPDVARVLKKMLQVNFQSKKLGGIYHWQANERLTKYDMIIEVASILQIESSEIVASLDAPKFPRPEDSRLECSRLEQDLGIGDGSAYRTSFHQALRHSFACYFAENIQNKMGGELRTMYSLKDVERVLEECGATINNKTLQGLINKDGHINAEDYETLVHAHIGEH